MSEETVTYELYEVERGCPDLMVASVTGKRLQALHEIAHYALMYGKDGPVSIRLASDAP